jgi:putative transposase
MDEYKLRRNRKMEAIVRKLNEEPKMCPGSVSMVSQGVAHMEKSHFTEPQPIACKWCGSVDVMKYGVRKGVQNYICRACGRAFTEKDAPYHMQTPTEQIGAALNMFYDGMSVEAIARHLKETHGNAVNASTIYRWVIRYTFLAMNTLDSLKPTVGDKWVVDETVIKVGGRNQWFWDIIDEKTRFLLASHLSRTRTTLDAATIMRRAWQKAGRPPKVIISDKLNVYLDGIELVFGAHARHVQSEGFSADINTNLIERFHGTIKARTKVLRAFKTKETAEHILDGFLLNYNFFRPHMSLANETPAEVAQIKAPVTNWTELVRAHKSEAQPQATLRQKREFGW